jgi:ParB-like chromosome segregation protein Spo0J
MTIAIQQDHTYQFFQPLSDEEYTALKKDIEDRGIKVPIELDSDGNILDGHHRWQIAQELGWTAEKIRTVTRHDLKTALVPFDVRPSRGILLDVTMG